MTSPPAAGHSTSRCPRPRNVRHTGTGFLVGVPRNSIRLQCENSPPSIGLSDQVRPSFDEVIFPIGCDIRKNLDFSRRPVDNQFVDQVVFAQSDVQASLIARLVTVAGTKLLPP